MRLSLTATVSCALALTMVEAAPTHTTSSVDEMTTSMGTGERSFPSEAVIAEFKFAEDEVPVLMQEEDGEYIVVVNSTLLETSSFSKREAEAGAGRWLVIRHGQPVWRTSKYDPAFSPAWAG